MTDLFALLADYHNRASGMSGTELASDRGNLSGAEEQELAETRAMVAALHAQASTRWAAATPDEIAAYDARVDALATQERDIPDAKRRAPATRSPARTFDAWAIWITLTLTAP